MTRTPQREDPIETSIRMAGSIGVLERLAGIGPAQEARQEFWMLFARLPAHAALDADVAELKRRIRAAHAVQRRGS